MIGEEMRDAVVDVSAAAKGATAAAVDAAADGFGAVAGCHINSEARITWFSAPCVPGVVGCEQLKGPGLERDGVSQ